MHRRRFVLAALGAAGVALGSRAARAAPFDIVYPRIRPGGDVHAAFALAVLDLAMKTANTSYTARQAEIVMERGRALAELANGSNTINLHWTSMEAKAERGLNVVRIPIHRGLIGYRVFVIRKDRQKDFDRIERLSDLKAFTCGQGLGWIDTDILTQAGLNVQTSTYETMFEMTQNGRVDYFPRGVIEAFAELEARQHREPDLVVEKRLMLKYRSDFIFYIATGHEALADTIEQGLVQAYREGAYMRLFNSHPYIQDALVRTKPALRKTFQLDNPYLSEADRRIPDEYWML
ncbi:hypothetical protein [Paraburkholderia haematera]|jgi:ABC-type amino acid transport/signal transduction systems, periplasmic component/domain|uniref:ABC-type amino acid transport substrate-binding protein n=1 Tax=Paraburkholderia haematera TaxID=2793077 RepID=A0ABM8R3I7_9BURK|nr:hypothetical protein [Paraburkholderia haematera]CAE6730905.1 hypothetical protein R69888_02056 [Paraburkholderia haematera]